MTEEIIKSVCKEFSVSKKDLLSKNRQGMLALARQALFLVTYECVTTNHSQIAKWYGRSSHNSTKNLVEAARDSCFSNKKFESIVNNLLRCHKVGS